MFAFVARVSYSGHASFLVPQAGKWVGRGVGKDGVRGTEEGFLTEGVEMKAS